jgi:Ser/Thr protein kinase RdoA (MazF antagonist)
VVAVARVTAPAAEEIARTHYGFSGNAQRLAAEHDDVFRIVAGDGSSRLLRVSVTARRRGPADGVSLQAAILLHLASAAPQLPVQRVIASLDGQPEVTLPEATLPQATLPEVTAAGAVLGGTTPPRLARMTSWLDGDLLGGETVGPGLRADIGATLARLSIALRGFSHPGARRTHWWDLQQLGRLRPLLGDLPPGGVLPEVREALGAAGLPAGDGQGGTGGLDTVLGDYLDHFDAVVRPRLARVPVQVIHTDFHGLNLLGDGKRITGILDFGDALTGPVAMDVAVAACYQLGSGADPLAPALDVVAGYHAVDPLDGTDLELAAEFIVARVVARIIVSQWNALREPGNRGYLLRRTPQAIEHYTALRRVGADEIAARLRAACP